MSHQPLNRIDLVNFAIWMPRRKKMETNDRGLSWSFHWRHHQLAASLCWKHEQQCGAFNYKTLPFATPRVLIRFSLQTHNYTTLFIRTYRKNEARQFVDREARVTFVLRLSKWQLKKKFVCEFSSWNERLAQKSEKRDRHCRVCGWPVS